MMRALTIQYVLIACAVAWSLWALVNRQFPAAVARWRTLIALHLIREGRAAWLRSIGIWIAPKRRVAASYCGGCDQCDPQD